MNSFEGKVVLVTGANSGIGEAAVRAFQEAGANVFAIVRRQDALEIARTRHPKIHWLLADVSKSGDVKAAVETVVREAGRLDAVVNNAALFYPTPIEHSAEDLVRRQFEANVYGPTYVLQAALPALKEHRGTVVNISSAAGHMPAPKAAHYAATKAALESLTRSWALELAPHGVRVNAIAPGPTETPVFEKTGLPAEAVPGLKETFKKMVPLGRMATTDEVARWIVAIADPSVTWLTGQVLSVDGGMSLM
ncbi:SDR family oxidoreductase [Pendulispora rubella]|uniref:SDR family oxidoreductase n=1 Tax=Pendulispora rubella TaxID=2741070 RepID=A0ABZ2KQL8_9BACT